MEGKAFGMRQHVSTRSFKEVAVRSITVLGIVLASVIGLDAWADAATTRDVSLSPGGPSTVTSHGDLG